MNPRPWLTGLTALGLAGISLLPPAARAEMPPAGPLRPFRFPSWHETRLPNGLTVAIVEHHELPVISLRLVVPVGGSDDPAGQAGLASLTGKLWSKESTRHNPYDVADRVDTLGAGFGSSADQESTSLWLKVVARHLDDALPLFAEVAVRPGFGDREFDLAVGQRVTQFQRWREQSATMADAALLKGLFGNSPYSLFPDGTDTTVRRLKPDDVRRFARSRYVPQHAVLVVAGDVTPTVLLPKLKAAFGTWKGTPPKATHFGAIAPPATSRMALIDRPGAVQSALAVGALAVPRRHPDFFPLLVADAVLGGTFMSRLNSNLREEKGYTYGAFSNLRSFTRTGYFRARADVETGITVPALQELLREVRRFGTDPVRPGEFADAKAHLTGSFPLTIETPEQIANWVVLLKRHGLGPDHVRTWREKVAAVTVGQMQAAWRRHVAPDRLVVVVCGDAARLAAPLGSLGPVERVDAAHLF